MYVRWHLTISIHGHFEPKLGGSPFSGTALMCWMVAGWLLDGKWGHYDFKHLIIWYQGAFIIRKSNQSGCDLFRHPHLKPLEWNVLIATQSRYLLTWNIPVIPVGGRWPVAGQPRSGPGSASPWWCLSDLHHWSTWCHGEVWLHAADLGLSDET